MTNPLFSYFTKNRDPSERALLHKDIAPIKVYARAARTKLPVPVSGTRSLVDALRARKSGRDFSATAVSLADLSFVLYWSLCEEVSLIPADGDFTRRPYPSGGAKFPIETYMITDAHEALGTAVYHYRPDVHELEQVAMLAQDDVVCIKQTYGYPFVGDAPILLVFTYLRERNIPKYGLFGEKLALIEVGHMVQNMYLCATECDLSLVALGGGSAEVIDSYLQIDSYNESMFYTLAVGTHQ